MIVSMSVVSQVLMDGGFMGGLESRRISECWHRLTDYVFIQIESINVKLLKEIRKKMK